MIVLNPYQKQLEIVEKELDKSSDDEHTKYRKKRNYLKDITKFFEIDDMEINKDNKIRNITLGKLMNLKNTLGLKLKNRI